MLQKRRRIKNKKTIEKARKKYCEYCGRAGRIEVHHIKTRGSGGDDVPENLISLCCECHVKAHSGQIPKEKLKYIVERRERKWMIN